MTSDPGIELRLLNLAAGFADRLPKQDVANATDLIAKREWGAGLEVLCTQLSESDVDLSAKEEMELMQLAHAMELDISGFGFTG